MKNIVKNKKSLFPLLLALVVGAFIGWLIKPASTDDHAGHSEAAGAEVWTCSMHPQIRQPEPGQCPICGMDLIPASSSKSSHADPMVYEMSPEAVALASVQTSAVSGVSPEGEVFLTGKIASDERQLASITAKYPGRIEQLAVNFTGQQVVKGQKLATIFSPELLSAQQELLEAVKVKDLYPELYRAAREKLRLWKLSDRQISEIEQSGRVRDNFDVLADKSGIVTSRNIAKGDYVNVGSTLFNIADLSKVWVLLDAYETDLPFVKAGNPVSFTLAALPGRTFEAKITYVDPVINPQTRAASVRAELVNKDMELKPDMFVNARIRSSVKPVDEVLAIPRTALLWTGKRSVVYVKVPGAEPAFEVREITLGSRMGDMYLVKEGLEAGEEVVTNGAFAVDAAAQLNGGFSMMNRPVNHADDATPEFRHHLNALTEKYMNLKNAFVESDAEKTASLAGEIEDELKKFAAKELDGSAAEFWNNEGSKIRQSLHAIAQGGDIDEQRVHFSGLSDALIKVLKAFKYNEQVIYVAQCPMAIEDQGASWLSEFKEIKNPYFGESMLMCGEVKESVKSIGENKGQAPASQHVH
ncbi:efflux RND transporter periplasmic adaptor subunit [Cytophagaceae bacterium ABcell3]|nr:efflux RND transporter periplasmic adaptor subunit [Cytophagaceae bacterium ABcell3]